MIAADQLQFLHGIRHSPVRNYILPGLTSWLVSQSDKATVRLFSMSREQDHRIVPHSHRFDFQCYVLSGYATNSIYSPEGSAGFDPSDCDDFCITSLLFDGSMGKYTRNGTEVRRCSVIDTTYGPGQWYGMTHDELHAIEFSRDAEVLFIEGPSLRNFSHIVEPCVGSEHIKTFKTEPWMFARGEA